MSDPRTVTYSYQTPPFPGALSGVVRSTDGAWIPCELDNMDYQGFLGWMAEGNAAPEGWTGPTNAAPATG